MAAARGNWCRIEFNAAYGALVTVAAARGPCSRARNGSGCAPSPPRRRAGNRALLRVQGQVYDDESVLRHLPSGVAQKPPTGVPAYVILHDATLREIAAHDAGGTRRDLGAGDEKAEAYGEAVLGVVAEG